MNPPPMKPPESFGPCPTLLGKLSCYWQNRAVSSGSKTITGSEEAGTAAKTEGAISVLAVDSSTPPANNTGGVPGNPSLETASEAGAAVQAIVTVNVTTTNELQLLLAGLLDNETGGVNGTFESITAEVPFMGFLAPVLGALGNATLVTDGLYGTPTSTTPSSTPASSSVWGWLWDSAAAAVLTLARGIVTLVEIAWTSELAAWIYLAHLTREALALDGYVLSRSANALAQAGSELVSAAKSALDFIIEVADSLLETVLGPVLQARTGYAQNTQSALSLALNSTSSTTGNISEAGAGAVWNAFAGALLALGLVAGFALEVTFVAMEAVPIGPTVIIGLVVGILLMTLLSGIFPQVTDFIDSGLVYLVEGSVNASAPQSSNQGWWRTLADAVGWFDTGLSTNTAAQSLRVAVSKDAGGKLTNTAVAFALAVIGAGLEFSTRAIPAYAKDLAIAGLVASTFSIVADGFSLYYDAAEGPAVKDVDYSTLALDGANWGLALSVLA